MYYMLAAMVLGIAFGELMNAFAPPGAVQFFDETVVKSVRTVFLNALSMMIAPVVFSVSSTASPAWPTPPTSGASGAS